MFTSRVSFLLPSSLRPLSFYLFFFIYFLIFISSVHWRTTRHRPAIIKDSSRLELVDAHRSSANEGFGNLFSPLASSFEKFPLSLCISGFCSRSWGRKVGKERKEERKKKLSVCECGYAEGREMDALRLIWRGRKRGRRRKRSIYIYILALIYSRMYTCLCV